MNKYILFLSSMITFSAFSSQCFRHGKNLELDVVSCLNSPGDIAQLVKNRINDVNQIENAIKKDTFVFFAPDLGVELAEHRQHWNNRLIPYEGEVQEKGFVQCNIDPRVPPRYMWNETKAYTSTYNGRAGSEYSIRLEKCIDINEYIIAYSLTLLEKSTIPEGPTREISYNSDENTTNIPIDRIEIDFSKTGNYFNYFYPDTSAETEVYKGTFCENNDIKKENNFKPISVKELVVSGNKREGEYVFFKLSRISMLPDKFFDRFPENIFLKIKLPDKKQPEIPNTYWSTIKLPLLGLSVLVVVVYCCYKQFYLKGHSAF